MKTGLILMTALPPTKGHQFLVDFAKNYLSKIPKSLLFVIVSGRDHEPISLYKRLECFSEDLGILVLGMSKNMPQEPEDHPDFWKIWKSEIKTLTYLSEFDYVFASETYGIELAKQMGATFVPCNIYREVISANATSVRNDPLTNFHLLHHLFQRHARKTITVFGPESIGKTTLSKALSTQCFGHYCPEWAREYLEEVAGPEITDQKMEEILAGQEALEKAVSWMVDKPFIFKDTDLLSTVGYYRLWKGMDIEIHEYKFADLYIIPNDQIPFTPDPLRYGGDKRETGNEFWKTLLDERGLPYYEIQSLSPEAQLAEAAKVCRNLFYRENNWRFER